MVVIGAVVIDEDLLDEAKGCAPNQVPRLSPLAFGSLKPELPLLPTLAVPEDEDEEEDCRRTGRDMVEYLRGVPMVPGRLETALGMRVLDERLVAVNDGPRRGRSAHLVTREGRPVRSGSAATRLASS